MAPSEPPEFRPDTLSDESTPGDLATPEFIAALLVDGDDDFAAWAIGKAIEERARAEVFDNVVQGAMELVGNRWENGRWTVAHEHLASVALTAALARLRPGDPDDMRLGPTAVIAAPEGEQHVSGLICLAQILEERGWHVENLGANTPALDFVAFVAARDVDLVGFSIGTAERLPALLRTIALLRAGIPEERRMPVMVGGHGTLGIAAEITGVDLVTASLVDAERFVAGLTPRISEPSER